MKKKINKGNIVLRKQAVFFALAIFCSGLWGCSSKETLLLESEDLVKAESEIEMPDAEPEEAVGAAGQQGEEEPLFVHICGAVKGQGVYQLAAGSRVYDVIEAAGGFTEEADEGYVNMALVLEDGWKIVIPTLEETSVMLTNGVIRTEDTKKGIFSGKESVPPALAGDTKDKDGLVNINTADKEALLTLPGIGDSRAENIVSYREQHGGFARIEDIMCIEGIKEGMFARLKDKICVE